MPSDDTLFEETILDKAIKLQNILIAKSRQEGVDDGSYAMLRIFFGSRSDLKTKIPDFVRRCVDLNQFWAFIQPAYRSYQERRIFISNAFKPLIEYLEAQDRAPGVIPITEVLDGFDAEHVQAAWQKALNRRQEDPEGAITAARMLVETVCKHILDDAGVPYPDDADLPKLWYLTAERLNLAPNQHQEVAFRSILGHCQGVVTQLGTIRNRVGDAHGQGRKPVKPSARHAELAVNLAGTMASFLVATLQEHRR